MFRLITIALTIFLILPKANATCETLYAAHGIKLCSFSRNSIDMETCVDLKFPAGATGAGTITNVNGLVEDPFTNKVYAVISLSSNTNPRELVEVTDLSTGFVRYIGNIGGQFSSISFACNGKLYGLTGKQGSNPSSLYLIDLNTAAATLVKGFTNGNFGNALAYDFDNSFLYRAGTLPGNMFGLQKIDVSNNFSSVDYAVTGMSKASAMVYESTNTFWISDTVKSPEGNATLYSVPVTGGAATVVGTFGTATTARKGFVCLNHTVARCPGTGTNAATSIIERAGLCMLLSIISFVVVW